MRIREFLLGEEGIGVIEVVLILVGSDRSRNCI